MIWTGVEFLYSSAFGINFLIYPSVPFPPLESPSHRVTKGSSPTAKASLEGIWGNPGEGVWFTYLFLSNENSKSIIDIIDVLLRKEDVQGGDKNVFSCPWGEGRERGRRKRREAKGLQCPISGCPLRLARPPVLLPAEAHLAAESVILITTDGELPLPLLHAGRRLLQGCGQPGVALPQGLQLNLPLLHIGSTVGMTGDGTD